VRRYVAKGEIICFRGPLFVFLCQREISRKLPTTRAELLRHARSRALTQGRWNPHGAIMLGGTFGFLGPSPLLSTIFRASSNARAGVGSGGVLVSRNPSSS
jgi:hypothetical protein